MKKELKNTSIIVRMSKNDMEKLEKIAEIKRRTKSDTIRIMIEDYSNFMEK